MPQKKTTTQKGGKKNRKIGRAARKSAHKQYTSTHQREKNKLKRIVQSCGRTFAERYASGSNLASYLAELLKRRPIRRQEAR